MERTVATIFFDEIVIDRPLFCGHYVLPAVAKGDKPALVKIPDAIQLEPIPMLAGGGNVPRPIFGDAIARDVVQHASEKGYGMSLASGPGVWVVREYVPEVDAEGMPVMTTVHDDKGKPIERQRMRLATPKERDQMFAEDLAQARARQDAYGEWLILQGDIFDEKPEQRVLIGNRSRLACRYYGIERNWLKQLKHDSNKVCQFCTSSIPAAAINCPKCAQVVDYQAFAREEAEREKIVRQLKKSAA